jgi:hypothetical protein
MSELTKEYFDQVIGGLATKGGLKTLSDRMNSFEAKLDELPTRTEFKALETKVDEIKETVQRIDRRDLEDSDAFAKDLVKHDRRITRLEKHLSLKPAS